MKNPLDPSEAPFAPFIEFGHLFDKTTRRYLVHYLQAKVRPNEHLMPLRYNSPDFDYLKEALDRIFDHSGMLSLCVGNEALGDQIIQDTLQWMRKTHHQIQTENPFQDELRRLHSWRDRPLNFFSETWYHLTNHLKENYTREEIDALFYEQRFETAFRDRAAFLQRLRDHPDAEEFRQADLLIADLLDQWKAVVMGKALRYELERIEEETKKFRELLYAKVEEYQKLFDLMEPFTLEVGRFWDMSKSLWKQTNFDVLSKYAQLLRNEKSIRELADLLGRLQQAQTELEEEWYEQVISKSEWRRSPEHRTEIDGIHTSDDLNRMLPSEASLLGDDLTEMLFYKRFADKQLLSLQYQGRELVRGNQVSAGKRERVRSRDRGPFIICIDTSGSMEGTPEYVAKVLCFAIIKMAAREKRKCYLISFSSGLQTINLLELEHSMDKVAKFLSMTFNGGTDVVPALSEAMRMLQTHDYQDADVLMVSDFVMYEIRDDIIERMQAEQRKGTRFHSLTVSDFANSAVVELFDNYWIYEPQSKSIARQLAQNLITLEKGKSA
jgi:uncharacterized protein with von Willebrand factor type A (vWA) domain